jgi:predicted DCC family thiol-disulfide oxidoreductase YuxK
VPGVSRDIVLYDRDCGFCRASLGVLLAWDRNRRLRPVALQDPEADRLLAGMPADKRMSSWHLVTGDGVVTSAGAALAPLLRRLPGGTWPARLAERFPDATERAYRWTADHRSLSGRPLPEAVKRWADGRIRSHG